MGRFSMPIVVGTALVLASCGGEKNKSDSALGADSTLNRDLALAGKDTAAQPQLTDVPATPAGGNATTTKRTTARTTTRTTTTKAPTKTASGNTITKATGTTSRTGEIPAGSTLSLRANSEICTNTSHVGDHFAATVNDAVVGSNG